MRIDQLTASVVEGDAISGDAVSIRRMLLECGFESDIYVQEPGPKPRADVPTKSSQDLGGGADAVIYHFSIGSGLTDQFLAVPGRRVVRYHNVTPAWFFEGWDPPMVDAMRRGRTELARLAGASQLGIGVSEYNRAEMDSAGFVRTAALPISPDLGDLAVDPDPQLSQELAVRAERGPIWLFVGRFVPNKRQVDLVRAFAAYVRGCSLSSTLLLVGSPFTASYRDAVIDLASELGLAESVVVRGPVSSSELAACYRAASVFICLSEHEGFCVPLIEAMYHRLPIVAYSAAAIPETAAGAAVLLDDKDPVVVAAAVDEVLQDPRVTMNLNAIASRRIQELHPSVLRERLQSLVAGVLN